jgi:hypothetical protein
MYSTQLRNTDNDSATMNKRGRPKKTNPEDDLSRQDSNEMIRISTVGEQKRRPNRIRAEDITQADIARIEAEACAKQGMWGQVAPERLIAAVVNGMGGEG